MSGLARRLQGMAIDMSAWRESAAFRRLTTGQVISLVGRQMTVVAVPYQVYTLTRSAVMVGLIGLAQAVPFILTSLFGGGVVDRVDRRRLLLVTQVLLCACSGELLAGAVVGQPVVVIFALVALAAAVSSLDSPARTSLIPNLVSARHLPGAIALNVAAIQAALIAGPALGGLVIARLGLANAYLVDVVSFAAAIAVIWSLPPQPPRSASPDPPLLALRRGIAFIRRTRVILGGYVMDLSAMVFGLPRALFPVLAATRFHTDAQGLGLLYAAPGVGALLGALASGSVSRSRRLGRVVIIAVAAWGVAIVGFGLSTSLWPALALLAVAGAADSFSAVCRSTIMQTLAPDELRGRLTATYMMVVVGGPYLGDVEAGVVAGATTAQFSVLSGGVLCVVGLVLGALRFPEVWRYTAAPAPPVPALTDDAVAGPPV